MSLHTKGMVCTLAGAVLWGFSGACIQYLLDDVGLAPLALTSIRTLIAGVLYAALIYTTQHDKLAALSRDPRSIGRIIVFGVFGLFCNQASYAIAIGFTNSGTATVLSSLSIVLVMIVTCTLYRKLPRLQDIGGLVLAMAATFFIATKGDPSVLSIPAIGLFWGFMNAVTVTFYIMFPRKVMERYGSVMVIGGGMLTSGVFSTLVVIVLSALAANGIESSMFPVTIPPISLKFIVGIIVISVVGTFAAYGLFLHGVSIVGGVESTMLGAAEPVSATVFPAILLGTVFVWADWVGLALMLGTIVLVGLPSKRIPRATEPEPQP